MTPVMLTPEDNHLGPLEAPLALIEYGDYQCPMCTQAYALVNRILTYFGPNVCFAFRHFPLSRQHPMAYMAAEAVEFAAQHGKFWQMHDLLYTSPEPLSLTKLLALAEKIGLSKEELHVALEKQLYRQKVAQSFEDGVLSGVNALPTFFVNGRRYNKPLAHLGKDMDEILPPSSA